MKLFKTSSQILKPNRLVFFVNEVGNEGGAVEKQEKKEMTPEEKLEANIKLAKKFLRNMIEKDDEKEDFANIIDVLEQALEAQIRQNPNLKGTDIRRYVKGQIEEGKRQIRKIRVKREEDARDAEKLESVKGLIKSKEDPKDSRFTILSIGATKFTVANDVKDATFDELAKNLMNFTYLPGEYYKDGELTDQGVQILRSIVAGKNAISKISEAKSQEKEIGRAELEEQMDAEKMRRINRADTDPKIKAVVDRIPSEISLGPIRVDRMRASMDSQIVGQKSIAREKILKAFGSLLGDSITEAGTIKAVVRWLNQAALEVETRDALYKGKQVVLDFSEAKKDLYVLALENKEKSKKVDVAGNAAVIETRGADQEAVKSQPRPAVEVMPVKPEVKKPEPTENKSAAPVEAESKLNLPKKGVNEYEQGIFAAEYLMKGSTREALKFGEYEYKTPESITDEQFNAFKLYIKYRLAEQMEATYKQNPEAQFDQNTAQKFLERMQDYTSNFLKHYEISRSFENQNEQILLINLEANKDAVEELINQYKTIKAGDVTKITKAMAKMLTGDESDRAAIKNLQKALRTAGYKIVADGAIGQNTLNAMAKYLRIEGRVAYDKSVVKKGGRQVRLKNILGAPATEEELRQHAQDMAGLKRKNETGIWEEDNSRLDFNASVIEGSQFADNPENPKVTLDGKGECVLKYKDGSQRTVKIYAPDGFSVNTTGNDSLQISFEDQFGIVRFNGDGTFYCSGDIWEDFILRMQKNIFRSKMGDINIAIEDRRKAERNPKIGWRYIPTYNE